MQANDAQQGKVIADAAGTLAAGVKESELKARLWGIAQNALGIQDLASDQSDALHLVKTELCTFCKDHHLIECNGGHHEGCDLVQIVTSSPRI